VTAPAGIVDVRRKVTFSRSPVEVIFRSNDDVVRLQPQFGGTDHRSASNGCCRFDDWCAQRDVANIGARCCAATGRIDNDITAEVELRVDEIHTDH
jgi:hypothetical protein